MTPEERAASLIGRIDETTDTGSLARMIAEEIRAAVAERDESSGPPLYVATESPRRVGRAVIGKPVGVPSAFRVVRHPVFDRYGGGKPLGAGWHLRCRVCATDEPEPGKTVLYVTPDGHYCESCVYNEYVNLRCVQLSLFHVQYQTTGEVEDALREELYYDDAQPDDDLIERLTREISEGVKSSEYIKPLPDLVSMLMREVYYRTLHKHRHELPDGYEPPPPDLEP